MIQERGAPGHARKEANSSSEGCRARWCRTMSRLALNCYKRQRPTEAMDCLSMFGSAYLAW
jgi:hypothetical protein